MSEEKRSTSGGTQPISRHPLFPAIVALWTGALFGLASLAVHPSMVERAVLAAGIDKVIPMATPPLGTTTRILIALAMTGLGAAIGALIAYRVARAPTRTGARTDPRTDPRTDLGHRTAVVREGSGPAETPAAGKPIAGRRRGLAVQPEPATDRAEPRPVRGPQILNVADFDLDGFEASDTATPVVGAQTGDIEAVDHSLTHAPATTPKPGFDFLPASASEAADRVAEIPETALPTAEECALDESFLEETSISQSASSFGHMAADRIGSAELDDLSPIELLERLALAMAQRREAAKLAITAPAIAEEEPQQAAGNVIETGAAPAVEPPAPQADHVSAALPRLPAALRPVDLDTSADGHENADDALPGYIPPRHIGLKPADYPENDEEADEEESHALAQGYSSLLDLSRPPHPHQTAASERPFDAPDRAVPEETEKALREALATLQRMSGAA